MAKVRNVIENDIKTTGAQKASKQVDRVSKSTETLTRNQTRLGQSSASAGRSFSAQASGLGGLVGVYAAAAANVFAITAAFDALGRAAQAEQIVRGTKLLALEIGQSGQAILDSVQEITQSQLTLAESAQNINIALSAGFNTEQIEQLSEVSLKASRALGRNLTDAFQRVVRGASKLEPELLDELGIFTRIDPAVEAYASKLNIAANSLTNYEKRQAFVNAVIEEGQKKFSAIDTSIDSSQKTFEQLRVSLTELALEFGQLVANVLTPIASFFKDNIGAALLLFGGILALVFGRALQAITGFATASLSSFSEYTAGLSKAALESSKNFDIIKRGAEDLDASIKKRGGLAGADGSGRFNQVGVSRADASAAAQARRSFLSGGADPVQQKKDIKVLERVRERLNSNSKAYGDAGKIIDSYKNSQKGATLATTGFAGVAQFASVAARGLTVAITALTGALGIIFTLVSAAQLVGSFFDVDVLAEIKGFFVDLSQNAENLEKGLLGAAQTGSDLVKELKLVGATDDDLKDLGDTLADITKDVDRFVDRIRGGAAGGIAFNIRQQGPQFANVDRQKLNSQTDTQNKLLLLQVGLQQAVNEGDRQRQVIFKNLISTFEKFGNAQSAVGAISRNLGLDAKRTAELFLEIGENVADTGATKFPLLNKEIDFAKTSFDNLNKTTQDSILQNILIVNTLDKAEEAFKRGAASSETLSKQLGGARSALQDFIDANDDVMLGFLGDPKELKKLQDRISALQGLVREVKQLEQLGKALDDTYGKFGNALDKAVQEGLIGIGGAAKDGAEQVQNQVNFLRDRIGLGDEANRQRMEEAELAKEAGTANASDLLLIRNKVKALKAVAGISIDLAKNIEKETKAREKTLQTLIDQLEVQKAQNELQKLQSDLALQQAQQQTAKSVGDAQIKNLEANLDLRSEINAQIQKNLAFERELFNLESDRLDKQATLADISANRTAAAGQAGRERGIAQQQSVISDFEAFPNLRSQEQLQQEQRKLIQLELDNQLAIIDAKEAQAEREYNRQLDAINRRDQLINKEIGAKISELNQLKDIQSRERSIRQRQNEIELQKFTNDASNIEAQIAIANKQAEIANLQIDAQEAQFALQNEAANKQIAALEAQQALVNGLREALGGESAFVKAIDQFLQESGGPGLGENVTGQIFQDLSVGIDNLRTLQTGIEQAQGGVTGARRAGANAQASGAVARLEEELSRSQQLAVLTAERQALEAKLALIKDEGAKREIEQQLELLVKRQENLTLEKQIIDETFNAKKEGFDAERQAAKDAADERMRGLMREKQTLGDLGNAVIGDLSDGLGNALNTAFDNIAQGQSITQGLGDVLRGTFENVRKTVLEETLVKPLQEKLKSGLGSIFGFGGEEKGAENATVRGGALLVTSDDGSSPMEIAKDVSEKSNDVFSSIREGLGGLKEEGVSVFSELGGSLKDAFGSVMGSIGGALGTSGAGGGGIFGSIFGGISSMFGFGGQGAMTGAGGFTDGGMFSGVASGGFVPSSNWQRLAAGGMARDRVPALLEPGEFVMKRSAANSIGGPALNQMNATGKAGGNVVVNIENQGTPQDATASEPRFDGEKFVIDIVTRDLRNNGPIRKSLRGGGAG